MRINLTKLLDVATKTHHALYSPDETTDGFYYVGAGVKELYLKRFGG